MTKNRPRQVLIQARHRKFWTLQQAAEYIGCNRNTLQHWESGKATPRREHVVRLCAVYATMPEELELDGTLPPELEEAIQSSKTLRNFIEGDLTIKLYAVAYNVSSHRALQKAVVRTIEEHDSNHHNDPGFLKERREALLRLAVMPYVISSSSEQLPLPGIQRYLAFCAAGITVSRELSKSTIHEDLMIAFEAVSSYLPVLRQVIKDSSLYRRKAAALVTQCLQIKKLLALRIRGEQPASTHAQ